MTIKHVSYAISEWKKRAPLYQLYRDYYDGNHALKFASKYFQREYGDLVKQLRENLCPTVVNAFTDRLAISSWTGSDDDADVLGESVEQGLSRLLNMVNREAFRCGDAYALVWDGGDGTPKPRFHRADQIVPHVDPIDPDRLDWAAKVWIDPDTGRGRVNVYYADRVEQYATRNQLQTEGVQAKFTDFPDSDSAWLPWADDDGPEVIPHEYGAVPVLWFRRDADENAGYGRSILADVIPLQDALNKSVADLVVLSERYSRPFWYLLNHQPPQPRLDPATGKPEDPTIRLNQRRFNPNEQTIFTTDGPGPFGQLDPPDMTRLLQIQDGYALKIARVVGIPAYYLTQTSGDVPSGESLRVLSSRLTAGVVDFQQDTTPVWRGLMQLLGFDDAQPVWAPAAELDEMEKLQAAVIKRNDLGYSQEDVLYDLGEVDVDGILARSRAERANVGQVAVDAFRRGEDPAEALR